jgi:hypothetical protein
MAQGHGNLSPSSFPKWLFRIFPIPNRMFGKIPANDLPEGGDG